LFRAEETVHMESARRGHETSSKSPAAHNGLRTKGEINAKP